MASNTRVTNFIEFLKKIPWDEKIKWIMDNEYEFAQDWISRNMINYWAGTWAVSII